MLNPTHDTIATRKLAVLVADGSDLSALDAVREPLTSEGALLQLVGVRDGAITPASGGDAKVDHALYSANSSLFDAVLVPDGAAGVETLRGLGAARRWIEESHRHGKAIAAYGVGIELLRDAIGTRAQLSDGALNDDHGVITTAAPDEQFAAALRSALAAHRDFDRPGIQAAP